MQLNDCNFALLRKKKLTTRRLEQEIKAVLYIALQFTHNSPFMPVQKQLKRRKVIVTDYEHPIIR